MFNKQQSVINLDPIDRKKKKGIIARFLITRWYGGKKVEKSEPYGHYMFCGPQRSGKTASALWYAELLAKKYRKRRIKHMNDKGKFVKFKTPPAVKLWSNYGVGMPFIKEQIFELIDQLDPYANEVRIFMIDEFQTYFPRGSIRKDDQLMLANLTSVFSQLAKRNCYVISTAQVYGRLDKSLREQCLYMVDCRVNLNKRIVNDFILQDDIIADDLGRWAGNPKYIKIHGLSKLEYDTKRLIRQ